MPLPLIDCVLSYGLDFVLDRSRITELTLFYVVLPIIYARYFSKSIKSKDPLRLRALTAVTIIIGFALVLMELAGMYITGFLGLHLPSFGHFSPMGLWCGYLWYLPFFSFLVFALVFYVRRKSYPATVILVIWCTMLVFHTAVMIGQIHSLAVWAPLLADPALNSMDRFVLGAMHVSRERIMFGMLYPLYWLILSAVAAYRAFVFKNVQ